MITNIDVQLLESLNQFARAAPTLDVTISLITHSYLFKGGVMMAFLWWAWFRRHPDQQRHRQAIMSVLSAALVSLAIARALALTLPHRMRPMHDASVAMELPVGMAPMMQGWSSFPSDHAALFGCIATGMFLVSRRAGWLATGYCLLFIMLPRVYNGLHYPSDVLAGYTIGALSVFIASREAMMHHLLRPMYHWFMHRPGLWYPLFFLLSFEMANQFDDLRQAGKLLSLILERWMQGNSNITTVE